MAAGCDAATAEHDPVDVVGRGVPPGLELQWPETPVCVSNYLITSQDSLIRIL